MDRHAFAQRSTLPFRTLRARLEPIARPHTTRAPHGTAGAPCSRSARYASIRFSSQFPAGPSGRVRDHSASTATRRGQPRTVSSCSGVAA